MPTSPAVLSVPLPEVQRGRLEAAAVARGQTVQSLVGTLVERFLREEDRQPPQLAAVVRTLRDHASVLAGRGVTGLWVFGSVARGRATPGSDIDLIAEFDGAAPPSLVGLAGLRAELTELLGAPADLVERALLRPVVRAAADQDAVRVF